MSSDFDCKSTLKSQLTPILTKTISTTCDRTLLISRVNEADKHIKASCLIAVDNLTCFGNSSNDKLSMNVQNKNISYNSIKFSTRLPSGTSIVRKLNHYPRAEIQDQSIDDGIGACKISMEIPELEKEAADSSFQNYNNKMFERSENISLKLTTGQTPETKSKETNHLPPEVLHLHPENLQVVRGSDFNLHAKFSTSSDELQVKWYRGTSEIFPG